MKNSIMLLAMILFSLSPNVSAQNTDDLKRSAIEQVEASRPSIYEMGSRLWD